MNVTGRCHCGQISFEAEIDPAQVRVCHCTDCQTLTGTAFRNLTAYGSGRSTAAPSCVRCARAGAVRPCRGRWI